MKRVYGSFPSWKRALEKELTIKHIKSEAFTGCIYLLHIKKVTAPSFRIMGGREICIVDDGYYWLEQMPKGSNYILRTIFNEKMEVNQWYFDIIDSWGINEEGIPYHDDLYLDVVVLPTGEVLLLDEDELEEALEKGDITKTQYDMAYAEAERLLAEVKEGKNNLIKNSMGILKTFITEASK